MFLNKGDKAPDFTLKNYDEKKVSLKDLKVNTFVLWFFPKANTPGWTTQGNGFRDEFKKFQKNNIQIVGVSADSPAKQKKFVEKYDFPYLMLCDESHDMLKAYKAWGPKKFMGRAYKGIYRITYVVNKNGIIDKVFEKVNTKTHACDVLDSIK